MIKIDDSLHKVLESTLKIRFQHCDPLGHLNNSAYIDYFLNAREEQLMHHYGLDTYQYAIENKKAWVVGSHSIQYLYPVKPRQEVRIVSFITESSQKSIVVHFDMYYGERKCATMDTIFVYIDLTTGRALDHEEHWMIFFETIKVS